MKISTALPLLALCLASACPGWAQKATTASPATEDADRAGGDYGGYLTYPEIKAKIAGWQKTYPKLVQVTTLGKTWQGRPIPLLRLGPPTAKTGVPEVLLIAGVHPREQQPQVCLMRFLDEVLAGYGKDARLTKLLTERTIWIVPILNVDGKVYDMAPGSGGDGKRGADWRKNRHPNADGTVGVDLNRNWAVRWGGNRAIDPLWKTTTTNTSGNIYEGPSPLSEPENQALANFMTAHPNLRAFMDIHSPLRNFSWPAFLTRAEWERYHGLLVGMQSRQKDHPYPLTVCTPDGEPGLDARGGNTGLTYTWSYYTRGIYGVNFEISDPKHATGITGRYPSVAGIMTEYENNVREPLLYFLETASTLPAARRSAAVAMVTPNLSGAAVPGAALQVTPSLPTQDGGPYTYAVLVSASPQIVVNSEYRRIPFTSGFGVQIDKAARPGDRFPMTVYFWDGERQVKQGTFEIVIATPVSPTP